MYRPLSFLLVLLVGLSVPLPAGAQFRKGLAQQTTEVRLNRKRPPKVYLLGTSIRVEGTTQEAQHRQIAERLGRMLETELLSHDSRLKPVNDAPETIITATVSRFSSTRTTDNRTVTVRKKTGTKTVRNQKTGKSEQEAVYSDVREVQNFVIVNGDVSALLQVREAKTGAVLDSDTITPTFTKEYRDGIGAPDEGALGEQMIRAAVDLIVPRLTPTREVVEVLLARPNDEIDEINDLGEAGLWSRMLERLELTKPLADPKKEAYRQYNLGVATEAIAYDAEDIAVSKKLLNQASSYYSRAIETKPDEKYFREPQTRIGEAITAYSRLDAQQADYSRALAAATAEREATLARAVSVEAGARSIAAPAVPAAFTNQDVIDLVKAGLDQPNLLAAIGDAPVTAFVFDTEGLKALLANKVPNPVITAMRTKQSGKATQAGSGAPRTTRPPAARGAAGAPAPPRAPGATGGAKPATK